MNSEFGAGVVVCLVKFSEHIANPEARRIEKAIRWIKSRPIEREKLMEEEDPEWQLVLALDEVATSSEEMLDGLIVTWANGASDHLSELDLDVAPESFRELRELLFELRYPDVGGNFRGEEEWLTMLSLWSTVAMDLDVMLGTKPEWGDWE